MWLLGRLPRVEAPAIASTRDFSSLGLFDRRSGFGSSSAFESREKKAYRREIWLPGLVECFRRRLGPRISRAPRALCDHAELTSFANDSLLAFRIMQRFANLCTRSTNQVSQSVLLGQSDPDKDAPSIPYNSKASSSSAIALRSRRASARKLG
jgi:hypothetical protein